MAYNVQFLKGSLTSYNNLTVKDSNTFYYIDEADNKQLYLGSLKLSNADEIAAAVDSITTNAEEIQKIKDNLGTLTGTKFEELAGKLATAEQDIINLKQRATDIEADVEDHETRLAAAEGKVTQFEGDISNLTDATTELGEKATQLRTDVDAAKGIADANATAIATLTADSGEGSVAQTVTDAINDFATKLSDNGDIDTFKELVDYVAKHGSEFSGLVGEVAANKDAISNLVGKEGQQGAIDAKIEAAIAAENLSQYATDEDLSTLSKSVDDVAGDVSDLKDRVDQHDLDLEQLGKDIAAETSRATDAETDLDDRLKVVEAMAGVGGDGEIGSIAQQIKDAKDEAILTATNNAKDYTNTEVSGAKTYAEGKAATAKTEAISETKEWANQTFATVAQGQKADTALQQSDIATGSTNGTITVKGSEVAVAGLGSAAFANTSDFDAANSAANALSAAQTYADGKMNEAKTHAETKAGEALTAAKAYTDTALTWGAIA